MLKIRSHPPFRLLYDLRWMELGAAGGVEQATYELVSAISRLDRRNSYAVHAPRSACWEWDFPPRFRVERIYSGADEQASHAFHTKIARHKAEETHAGFDLVHSTCSYIHPELMHMPGVLTIHDLQHLHHPEFFTEADRASRESLYRTSAAQANQIICISEFTRRDVHERFGVPFERMTTIWNIPSGVVAGPLGRATSRDLVQALGVHGPFLFYPAQSWLHKNHALAVEAFVRALPDLPRDMKLVFAGRDLGHEHPAAVIIRERGLSGRVLHLGFRSALEIRALLDECTALFFPSLFEGFGMPVAEAVVATKPIACSNATSLPEIVGDAAIMFDPHDADAMAVCMVRLATERRLREQLAEAARTRRSLFSARLTAMKTLAVYEKALAA